MSAWTRWWRFNGVGLAGIGVQLMALWLLTDAGGVNHRIATGLAVLAALLHNFIWHRVWTWADRPAFGQPVAAFMGFAASNGLVSVVGNVLVTAVLVERLAVPVLAANLVAIALCGLVNYTLADRVVFRRAAARGTCVERARPRSRGR